jgi:hypothetical protein
MSIRSQVLLDNQQSNNICQDFPRELTVMEVESLFLCRIERTGRDGYQLKQNAWYPDSHLFINKVSKMPRTVGL